MAQPTKDMVFCADVRERLGGRGGHTADIQEGQVTEEDVHGRVEL